MFQTARHSQILQHKPSLKNKPVIRFRVVILKRSEYKITVIFSFFSLEEKQLKIKKNHGSETFLIFFLNETAWLFCNHF